MNSSILLLTATFAALAFTSCANRIDMPKGTSKGYTSARLVERNPNLPATSDPTERRVHSMIQNSLEKQFTSKGMSYGKSDADLIVAYLVVYQEPGMTAGYPAYFGYGRDDMKIADVAHIRGVVDGKRPDYFRRAGIVVDVIDRETNKHVYRGISQNDVVKGASESTRAARIDAAVREALAGFFK